MSEIKFVVERGVKGGVEKLRDEQSDALLSYEDLEKARRVAEHYNWLSFQSGLGKPFHVYQDDGGNLTEVNT